MVSTVGLVEAPGHALLILFLFWNADVVISIPGMQLNTTISYIVKYSSSDVTCTMGGGMDEIRVSGKTGLDGQLGFGGICN